MQRVIRFTRENLNTMVGVALVLLLLGGYLGRNAVSAHHEPANKLAAAGTQAEIVNANDTAIPVLSERVKMSGPTDLVLSVTSECSILTALRTGDDDTGTPSTDSARAFGQLTFYIEIDGNRVPISTVDQDSGTAGTQTDNGEVVFCNREYQRSVTDSESNSGGVDTTEDYIRTRTANAFNWLAINTGFAYDEAGNGNNILDVVVYAEYTREPTACTGLVAPEPEDACAQAIVGARTLIAEPTKVSVHEQVEPTDPDGGS